VGLALVLSLLPATGGPSLAAAVPNDPYFADFQWNLRQVHAPEAWDLTTGDRRVIIAIVDTGIALDHPDLIDKLVPGINLVTPGAPPSDDNGHGTHMAGIAAAATNNALGVAGLNWEARLMPVKVLDQNGGGDVNRVAQGITWAVDQGARVINLSFDGPEPAPVLADAVQYARNKGALVVAAVGNDGRADTTYPAAFDGVMAVAATDRNDQRLASSNTGSYVAVAAPGQDIPSTYWDATAGNTYALASTTSQAAPHVAGLAGLILSVNPDLSGDAVRRLIENHADDVGRPGRDDETGFGRINAYRSVLAALPWNYDSGGGMAFRAPAEAAARLYLPYVVKASDGWTSSIMLQNPTTQSVTLNVSFIGSTGSVVTSVGAGLSPQGATTLPLSLLPSVPAGFQGTAVIDASGRLAAVVTQDRAGSSRHGYVGVTSGA
jgi:subtilisin family serine protease